MIDFLSILGQVTLDGHSTAEMLGLVATLQAWMIHQIYGLKASVKTISSHCKRCGSNKEKE